MADTLQQLFRQRSDQDNVAVKYGDRTWTWREHVAEARVQAAALIGVADPDGRCTSACCWPTPRTC